MHFPLLFRRDCYLNKMKYQGQNPNIRISSELASHIYDSYKNSVISHGCHIYIPSEEMAIAILCCLPSDKHGMSKSKYLLCCC